MTRIPFAFEDVTKSQQENLCPMYFEGYGREPATNMFCCGDGL